MALDDSGAGGGAVGDSSEDALQDSVVVRGGRIDLPRGLPKHRKPLEDDVRVSAKTIFGLSRRLAREQTAFKATGGLHACALFDAEGTLLALREDVGRHNALDKLAGRALLEKRLPLTGHIVLLSGRSSFEMMQKAHAAGIAIVVAIGAPSSLAVEFARDAGQTLCGFVRGRSMNIYAGAERIA